jgi:hypothetical protein
VCDYGSLVVIPFSSFLCLRTVTQLILHTFCQQPPLSRSRRAPTSLPPYYQSTALLPTALLLHLLALGYCGKWTANVSMTNSQCISTLNLQVFASRIRCFRFLLWPILRFAADRILALRTGPCGRTLSLSEGVWIKRTVLTFRHNNNLEDISR